MSTCASSIIPNQVRTRFVPGHSPCLFVFLVVYYLYRCYRFCESLAFELCSAACYLFFGLPLLAIS